MMFAMGFSVTECTAVSNADIHIRYIQGQACFTNQMQLSECDLVNELLTGRKYVALKG